MSVFMDDNDNEMKVEVIQESSITKEHIRYDNLHSFVIEQKLLLEIKDTTYHTIPCTIFVDFRTMNIIFYVSSKIHVRAKIGLRRITDSSQSIYPKYKSSNDSMVVHCLNDCDIILDNQHIRIKKSAYMLFTSLVVHLFIEYDDDLMYLLDTDRQDHDLQIGKFSTYRCQLYIYKRMSFNKNY